jgi:RNA-directed DNA polymerase
MSDERQNHQLELAWRGAGRGEAQTPLRRGTESHMVNGVTENPAPECLREEVGRATNLRKAWQRVKANRGAPGGEGMTVAELEGYFEQHEAQVGEQLLSGTDRPQPLKRVKIPKPEGGWRNLGLPTAVDRLVPQAWLAVRQPHFDPHFAEYSFGLRPGRSAQQAVARAPSLGAEGRNWVVDFELEQFFDRLNHDRRLA